MAADFRAPARIAARLRERLPGDAFRVVEGADGCDVFSRPAGVRLAWADARDREWLRFRHGVGVGALPEAGSVEPGPGWPERLAAALADALLGAGR